MKKKYLLIIPFFLIILLLLAGFFALPLVKKSKAALQINSSPQATVFLNDDHVGQTPYDNKELKAQEYSLKLVPQSNEEISWERTIQLVAKTLTVINWDFGSDSSSSQGEILQLESIANSKTAEIAIISNPDSAIVKLDGQPQGFTPLTLEDVSAGDHVLIISAPGFLERKITAKAVLGNCLNVNVQLAQDTSLRLEYEEASPSAETEENEAEEEDETTTTATPSTSSAQLARPYVEILDTPTGWLNIRSSPSTYTDDNIIAKVNPGETYPFIEANDEGWYKIELNDDQIGWLSGQYATLYR